MDINNYSKEFILGCYLDLHRTRSFDTVASELFLQGKMSGNIHTCIGQEAITVGGIRAINKDDILVHSHRGHAQPILKGCDSKLVMAELFGKKTGYCEGKGGSMHVANMDLGVLSSNGIVGASMPMATGSALASKIKNDGKVTIVFSGDAATNTGCFHEALNMASAWKLPIIFFCENNGYGVSVNIERVTNVKDLSVRSKAYGIPGVTIDGNDVFEIYETVKEAMDRARRGEGPTLIEAKVYRQHGHFEGDSQGYKTEEEIAEGMAKDPIARFEKAILDANIATKAELEELAKKGRAEMDAAAEFAMNSPFPEISDAFTDIYAMDNDWCISK